MPGRHKKLKQSPYSGVSHPPQTVRRPGMCFGVGRASRSTDGAHCSSWPHIWVRLGWPVTPLWLSFVIRQAQACEVLALTCHHPSTGRVRAPRWPLTDPGWGGWVMTGPGCALPSPPQECSCCRDRCQHPHPLSRGRTIRGEAHPDAPTSCSPTGPALHQWVSWVGM